jgi:tetratricopeptide (TPR) repeat protein
MDKYRIRLANGRVVGPFNQNQITELYAKGHIDGTEECQLFPTGEWLKVLDFDSLAGIFNQQLKTQTFDNSTVIKKLSDLTETKENKNTTTKANNTSFTASNFKDEINALEKNEDQTKPSQENEDPNFPKEFSYKNLSNKETSRVDVSIPEKKIVEQKVIKAESTKTQIDESEKTIVKKSNLPKEDTSEKTLVNVSTKQYLDQLKKQKEKDDLEAQKREASRVKKLNANLEQEVAVEVVDPNQSTQMFNISQLKDNLRNELVQVEQELDLEKREHENKIARAKKQNEEELGKKNPTEKKKSEENKSKKGMKPIIAVVFLCIFAYMFFPDEEEVKRPDYIIDVITPQIDFPVPFKDESPEKSKAEAERGDALYAKGDLTSIYEASKAYKNSLELKFNGNESLTKLILAYAELLPDVQKENEAGNDIFKLIQIAKTKSMYDLPLTTGTAIFYNHFKRYSAGIKTIEDFLLVNKKKSQKLIAVYIQLLVNSGNISKAKATLDKILPSADKSADMYYSIADYYLSNNEFQESSKWTDEGLNKYPKFMPLLIMKSDLLVHNEDFKGLTENIKKIKSLEAEHSKRYYSKYLEYYGLLSVVAKKTNEAITFFKEALKIKQSPELISKLAALQVGGSDKAVDLIATSKSIDYMNKAREAVRKRKYESALNLAIEATDIAPDYFPAKLLLAEFQVKQGYFSNAIETLSQLYQKYPNESSIAFSLISAYIESYKFKDANMLLDTLATSDFKNTPEYLSAMGRIYAKQGDFYQAVTWLQKAINVNPIYVDDYYILTNVYLKNRSYQKAKIILTKAMDLDPSCVDYVVAYSKILYEMDDAETAIGFLKAAESNFKDDPSILSEIAIYYYRSGQQKYFEEYKKQLEALPEKNKNLYQFLIKTAELDDKPELIIKYLKDLLQVEPGDLEARMQLASALSESKKYQEALDELLFIEGRLPTYPRLLYQRSKVLLEMGKNDEAIKEANKELESNPNSEEGNILLGNIHVKLEDYIKAEQFYKNAQKNNSKSVDALIGLAWISFKRNNIETAMDLYLKVTTLDPNNSYAHKQLGLVYKLMGQGSLAIESFKVYLDLEPDAKDKDKIKGYISELQ